MFVATKNVCVLVCVCVCGGGGGGGWGFQIKFSDTVAILLVFIILSLRGPRTVVLADIGCNVTGDTTLRAVVIS